METNLQYVDKRLAYHFINRDDLLLQQSSLKYTNSCAHMQNTQKYKHKRTHTHSESHYERQQGKYQCFESITSYIFIFLSPAVIIFSPVKQIKMPKPNRGRGSDFPLSGSQTQRSYKQSLCTETGPVCSTVCALAEHVCADDLGQHSRQWKRDDFVYSGSPKGRCEPNDADAAIAALREFVKWHFKDTLLMLSVIDFEQLYCKLNMQILWMQLK